MGTNFYARKIPTTAEIKEAKAKLGKYLNGKLSKWEFNEFLDTLDIELHLGKRSSGWQFCWEAHPKYYEDNLKSIKKFLSQDDVVIHNEYGEEFTLDQFIKKEIGKSMYNDPEKYINDEQYCAKYKESYYRPDLYWTSKDGLRFCNTEFS